MLVLLMCMADTAWLADDDVQPAAAATESVYDHVMYCH